MKNPPFHDSRVARYRNLGGLISVSLSVFDRSSPRLKNVAKVVTNRASSRLTISQSERADARRSYCDCDTGSRSPKNLIGFAPRTSLNSSTRM